MNSSVGLSFNAYKETKALPGMLELASQFYDELVMVSAPPNGGNNDDTIDIAKDWGCKVVHSTIENGFGFVRTQCIKESSCEWVIIQDADERIFWNAWQLSCDGDESWDPKDCPNPDLTVTNHGGYDQGKVLKSMIQQSDQATLENPEEAVDAIQFSRRHWFDMTMRKPTQNWYIIADWQLRCVRNRPYIRYTRGMHESIVDTRTGKCPSFAKLSNMQKVGLFFDHFHLWFKEMEIDQRKEDIEIYNRLHERIDKAPGPQEPGVKTQDHKG